MSVVHTLTSNDRGITIRSGHSYVIPSHKSVLRIMHAALAHPVDDNAGRSSVTLTYVKNGEQQNRVVTLFSLTPRIVSLRSVVLRSA